MLAISFLTGLAMPHSHAILAILISFFGDHHMPHPCQLSAEATALAARWDIVAAGEPIAFRLAPPLVALREAAPHHLDPSGKVLSADHPQYWTVVPYGPLTVEVRLPVDPAMSAEVEQVVLMIDGEPISNNRYMTGPLDPPELSAAGQLLQTYVYNLPCPELGKHLIQARYKIGGIWSGLSVPLRYEVRLPQPPRIIALSDSPNHPAPLSDIGLVTVRSRKINLKLANVVANDKIVVEIDGKTVATTFNIDHACCVSVPVQGHVASGVHRIAVRSIHGTDSCSITTELSNEVAFHYHDENVYLLRPGRGCETGVSCPASSESQGGQAEESSPTQPTTPQESPSRVGNLLQHPKADYLHIDSVPLPHGISNELAPMGLDPATSDHSVRLIAQLEPIKTAQAPNDLLDQVRADHQSTLKTVMETRKIADDAVANANEVAATVVAAAAEHEQALAARTNAERVWRETKAWVDGTKLNSTSVVLLADSANDAAWLAYTTAANTVEKTADHLRTANDLAASAKALIPIVARARTAADGAVKDSAAAMSSAEMLVKELLAPQDHASAQIAEQKLQAEVTVANNAKNKSDGEYARVLYNHQSIKNSLSQAEDALAAARRANNAIGRAIADAVSAASRAKSAFTVANQTAAEVLKIQLQAKTAEAWRQSTIRDANREADLQIETAQPEKSAADIARTDVLRAQVAATAAQRAADAEEAKANARIAALEAQLRIDRAASTHTPPSPFYFASAAYFPVREFGFRGEIMDREGAIIHEDMKFSFDREGNYALEFAISTPAVPVTVRMQLLIQPSDGAPWYTITLPPMQFKPEAGGHRTADQEADEKGCVVAYNHKCSGRSEILRRCYPQMADDAKIRREGTARFGHGFELTRQAAAF